MSRSPGNKDGGKIDALAVSSSFSKMKIGERSDDESSEGGESSGVLLLPRSTSIRVAALKKLHEQKESVFEEYKAARCALEAQFRAKYNPLFKEREDIVTGSKEIEIPAEELSSIDVKSDENVMSDDVVIGIPDFWKQSILRHEALSDLVEEQDLDLLSHIYEIKSIDRDDLMGFTLKFYFTPNEYFSDSVLTKSYVTANILDQGEPLLQSVNGCTIHWKAGKNLCEKTVRPKQWKKGGRGRGKGPGNKPPKCKIVKTDSFFKFFMNPLMLDDDDEYQEEDDESAPEQYELSYDVDYEVALTFRNHIIPNAVLWYTGEATQSDDETEENEESEDEEEMESTQENVVTNNQNQECKQS
mmetsp:Transcript_4189/g.6387  ORF Transcript_4189/g.6387 Transcript_4189/m.6387 type:complete len:357 (-) Transcript_4189:31-1101(-)